MKRLFLLAICALFVNSAFAGDLKFMVSEDISYDDNIYLTDGDEKDSFISSTQAGIAYKNPIAGTGLNLSATGMGGYNAYTEKNSKNGFWNAYADVNLSNDLVKLGDTFIYTSDPANSELTERAKRYNNNAYLSARTSREKMFGIGVTANDSYDHYIDSDYSNLNRNRINAGVEAFWNISAKTSAFIEYVYTNIDYDHRTTNKIGGSFNDSHGDTFAIGIDGKVAPKIDGIAKLTYTMRHYGVDAENYSSYEDMLGYFVALEWNVTAKDKIRLSGERKFEETAYINNRYFADTLVSLAGFHKLNDKLTLGLTLAYENMDYDRANNNGVKRNDDLYTVRPSVDYQFKEWLSAGVWYQWRTRNSNVKGADYDSNKAGVFVKAIF